MITDQITRKKLLFLIPSLHTGGSERVLSILAKHLDTEKFEITVVVIDGSNPFYALDESRLRLIDMQTLRVRQSFFKVIRLIRREQPDLVVSTLSHLNIFIGLVKLFIPRKIRFIARESTILSVFHRQESMTAVRNWLVRRLYPRFDGLICQSQRMANDMKENYGIKAEKISLVNNPVDTERVWDLASTEKVPAKNARFRFVSAGRLESDKTINKALEALAKLDTRDFEYHIIGDGSERQKLETLTQTLALSDNVHFHGRLKNPFKWLLSADLFFLPSEYEGFPNSLLEAGAIGTPAIAFSCGTVTDEIIINGLNGFVVPDGDETAFAAAILRGCSTDFDRAAIQNLTKERFGVAEIVKAYERIYLDVLSH